MKLCNYYAEIYIAMKHHHPFLIAFAGGLSVVNVVHAALPPALLVNDDAKECFVSNPIYTGSCHSCVITDDSWRRVGSSFSSDCPPGYGFVESDRSPVLCTYIRNNEHCCTSSDIAGPVDDGDCSNVLVNTANPAETLCTFVEDISLCQPIPEGWEQRTSCPGHRNVPYKWVDDAIECKSPNGEPSVDDKDCGCGSCVSNVRCGKSSASVLPVLLDVVVVGFILSALLF